MRQIGGSEEKTGPDPTGDCLLCVLGSHLGIFEAENNVSRDQKRTETLGEREECGETEVWGSSSVRQAQSLTTQVRRPTFDPQNSCKKSVRW